MAEQCILVGFERLGSRRSDHTRQDKRSDQTPDCEMNCGHNHPIGSLVRRMPCHRHLCQATLTWKIRLIKGYFYLAGILIHLLFALGARLWQNSGDSHDKGWRPRRGLAMA
ncbi:hypothetical protein EMEDMD4_130046 [Sinorhizobium medicae]|uniref:Transmembrane protein n=1 Tax=Sinorhizobium medicae TaxID=110321 RepID=A0A508WR57_9HYPH|nr:hypothetical protein EMEDMD4_130046 [Sinorhizobium medicae]